MFTQTMHVCVRVYVCVCAWARVYACACVCMRARDLFFLHIKGILLLLRSKYTHLDALLRESEAAGTHSPKKKLTFVYIKSVFFLSTFQVYKTHLDTLLSESKTAGTCSQKTQIYMYIFYIYDVSSSVYDSSAHNGEVGGWGRVPFKLSTEVGGWGRVPFSRNLMSPTPRRKWYLTTGRRAH